VLLTYIFSLDGMMFWYRRNKLAIQLGQMMDFVEPDKYVTAEGEEEATQASKEELAANLDDPENDLEVGALDEEEDELFSLLETQEVVK
jgi:hypothetical protein